MALEPDAVDAALPGYLGVQLRLIVRGVDHGLRRRAVLEGVDVQGHAVGVVIHRVIVPRAQGKDAVFPGVQGNAQIAVLLPVPFAALAGLAGEDGCPGTRGQIIRRRALVVEDGSNQQSLPQCTGNFCPPAVAERAKRMASFSSFLALITSWTVWL